jgi:hypothetical protein
MFFNLLIAEFENLKSFRECSLCCFCLCKVVDHFRIWVSLFYIVIVEIDDRISIWESFSPDTVAENDLFLSILVCSLDFSIVSYDLILNSRV